MATTLPPLPRYESLDLMRGIAVMAMLLMNIFYFAMPGAAYFNPLLGDDASLVKALARSLSFWPGRMAVALGGAMALAKAAPCGLALSG